MVVDPRLSAARAPAFPSLPFCSLLFLSFHLFLPFLVLVGCGFLHLRDVHAPPLFFYLVGITVILFMLVCPCLCYFVPVITVLLRFSLPRSGCCRVVGVRVFVWKGCGSCGGQLAC